jgi:hypothetical protein
MRKMVGCILRVHTTFSAREFLREERESTREQRDEIGGRASQQEREESNRLPRSLEGEYDRCQKGVSGAGKDRRHADQSGNPGVDADPWKQIRAYSTQPRAEPTPEGEERG